MKNKEIEIIRKKMIKEKLSYQLMAKQLTSCSYTNLFNKMVKYCKEKNKPLPKQKAGRKDRTNLSIINN